MHKLKLYTVHEKRRFDISRITNARARERLRSPFQNRTPVRALKAIKNPSDTMSVIMASPNAN